MKRAWRRLKDWVKAALRPKAEPETDPRLAAVLARQEDALDALTDERDAGRRAALLLVISATLSDLEDIATERGESGNALTYRDAAELAWLLATVERSVHLGRVVLPEGGCRVLRAGRPVLARMAESTRLAVRAAYMRELYYLVEPVVGPAAALLEQVPSPGRVGWTRTNITG